jgi:hypothetical protein
VLYGRIVFTHRTRGAFEFNFNFVPNSEVFKLLIHSKVLVSVWGDFSKELKLTQSSRAQARCGSSNRLSRFNLYIAKQPNYGNRILQVITHSGLWRNVAASEILFQWQADIFFVFSLSNMNYVQAIAPCKTVQSAHDCPWGVNRKLESNAGQIRRSRRSPNLSEMIFEEHRIQCSCKVVSDTAPEQPAMVSIQPPVYTTSLLYRNQVSASLYTLKYSA